MEIKCDKCGAVAETVTPETAKDGEIEYTFFRCPACGEVYSMDGNRQHHLLHVEADAADHQYNLHCDTFLNKQRATNNKQRTEKQYERSAKGASYAIQNMYFSES